jgi:tetratricopeptide (TPR) repeat protein
LAEAYYQTKQYEKAMEIIKKAININPNYNYLHEQLKKIENSIKQENEDNTEEKIDTRGSSDGE